MISVLNATPSASPIPTEPPIPTCSYGDVRLANNITTDSGDSMTISGLIEVCVNGNFIAVCSFVGIGNNFTINALLDLVCTTLGYDGQFVCRSVCM